MKIDAKEALQYVYCVGLAADQGDGVGKEQVESAWELVRRIIVSSNGGAGWEELVGGFRADGSRFVSFASTHDRYLDSHLYRVVSSNRGRHYCNSKTSNNLMSKFLSGPQNIQKKMTEFRRPSSCTT